jgi:hypothetical protein
VKLIPCGVPPALSHPQWQLAPTPLHDNVTFLYVNKKFYIILQIYSSLTVHCHKKKCITQIRVPFYYPAITNFIKLISYSCCYSHENYFFFRLYCFLIERLLGKIEWD